MKNNRIAINKTRDHLKHHIREALKKLESYTPSFPANKLEAAFFDFDRDFEQALDEFRSDFKKSVDNAKSHHAQLSTRLGQAAAILKFLSDDEYPERDDLGALLPAAISLKAARDSGQYGHESYNAKIKQYEFDHAEAKNELDQFEFEIKKLSSGFSVEFLQIRQKVLFKCGMKAKSIQHRAKLNRAAKDLGDIIAGAVELHKKSFSVVKTKAVEND